MKNYKKAFTLAETLMVIMIIGVIAALTIPMLGSKADRSKGLFKKAYSLTERTVGELVNDETYYPFDYNKFGFAETTDMKILGTDDMYTSTTDYNHPVKEKNEQFDNALIKFCNLFISNVNIQNNPTFDKDGNCEFITSDGINWQITKPTDPDKNKRFLIKIDTNGPKAPNLPTNVANVSEDKDGNVGNRDTFFMYVKFDGKMELPENDEIAKKYLQSSDINRQENK